MLTPKAMRETIDKATAKISESSQAITRSLMVIGAVAVAALAISLAALLVARKIAHAGTVG